MEVDKRLPKQSRIAIQQKETIVAGLLSTTINDLCRFKFDTNIWRMRFFTVRSQMGSERTLISRLVSGAQDGFLIFPLARFLLSPRWSCKIHWWWYPTVKWQGYLESIDVYRFRWQFRGHTNCVASLTGAIVQLFTRKPTNGIHSSEVSSFDVFEKTLHNYNVQTMMNTPPSTRILESIFSKKSPIPALVFFLRCTSKRTA